ncbi:MAG: response regulator [Acidobacteria bacterium]|nr:response regulator [Acidobacteriota bacterium]
MGPKRQVSGEQRARGAARRGIALALALAALVASAPALNPDRRIHEYGVSIWTTESGLPQQTVRAVVQTDDGYLWLATYEGLVRFDGFRFTVFEKSNTPEIRNNSIRNLFLDSQGRMWICSTDGLAYARGGAFRCYTRRDGLPSDFISTLAQDADGFILAGTDHGLSALSGDRFHPVREGGLDRRVITCLAAGAAGGTWVGTARDGLFRLRDGTCARYTVESGLPSNQVQAVCESRRTGVWIGTPKGLARLHQGALRVFTTADGLPDNSINCLFEDQRGSLWVGTENGGLSRFRNGAFTSRYLLNRPSECAVYSINEDLEGSLWVGTWGGLYQFKDDKFALYNRRNGLPVDAVRSLFQDRSGRIWVGTVGGGLLEWKDGRIRTVRLSEKDVSDSVLSMAESPDGTLWLGTYTTGLYALRGDTVTCYTDRLALPRKLVRAVLADAAGHLWVGIDGGGVLMVKEDRVAAVYDTRNGLSDNAVYCLAQSADGSVWAGTYGGRLNQIRDGRVTVWGERQGLTPTPIFTLRPERDGTLWLGTNGGVIRFRAGRFVSITSGDGLASDKAFQIVEDQRGFFWMNSNKGIFRVRKAELDDFADRRKSRVECVLFGREQGYELETTGPAQPAGWLMDNGKVWLASRNGVVVFDPYHIPRNPVPPPVIIESALIDNRPFAVDRPATAEAGAGRVDVAFTAISPMQPRQVRFQYWLEPFDRTWVEGGAERSARYTNIPPGEYTFHVRACNNDGVWNTGGKSFSFRLKPHFYQTVWFYALLALSLVLAGYGLFWVRSRAVNLRREKRQRLNQTLLDLARSEALRRGNVEGLLEELAGGSCRALRLQRTGVWVCDAGATRFRRLILHDREEGTDRREAVLAPDALRDLLSLLEGRRSFAVEDCRKTPPPGPANGGPPWSDRTRALLAVPIQSGGRMKGILCCEHAGSPRAWTHDEQSFAASLADYVSLVLETAERRQAEAELRKAEAQYRGIVENAAEGIFRATPSGRIVTANRAFASILGYAGLREVLEGGGVSFPGHFKDPGQSEALFRQVLEEGSVRGFEFAASLRDGSPAELSVNAHVIRDAEQRALYVEGMLEDVTGKKRAEAMRVAKEAAEKATRAKSDFLANMSHEIRTPLNAIIGFTWLMQQTDLTGRQQDYADKIAVSSEALLGVINEVLDFSKIEAGKLELEAVPFRLSRILDNLEGMFSQKADEKGLTLRVSHAPEIPACLRGDPLRLRQVLINLIGNAVKFTRAGEVEVATEPASREGERVAVRFTVKDSGVGMSAEEVGRLFQPFSQGGSYISRVYGGTGLGLMISQRLVELMGGRIEVASEPGRGSVFSFTVGFAVCDPDVEERAAPAPDLSGLRALIVEDNPVNQQVLWETLAGGGIVSDLASNGREALQALEKQDYDLVLMDIQMPEMDGYEATRLIRENPRYRRLPIIAMTAHAVQGYREECLARGMSDYVTKPIIPETLFATLGRWGREYRASDGPGGSPAPAHSRAATGEPVRPPEPAPGGPSLPDRLPGFDLAEGTRRIGGNRARYARFLADFRGVCTARCEEIRTHRETGDREKLAEAVHGLKGAAGNLSAVDILGACRDVEKALRGEGEGTPAESVEHLLRTLREAEAALSCLEAAATPAPPPRATSPSPTARLRANLAELARRVRRRNPRAEACLEAVFPDLDAAGLSAEGRRLGDQIRAFAFAEAKKTLAAIAEQLGIPEEEPSP